MATETLASAYAAYWAAVSKRQAAQAEEDAAARVKDGLARTTVKGMLPALEALHVTLEAAIEAFKDV